VPKSKHFCPNLTIFSQISPQFCPNFAQIQPNFCPKIFASGCCCIPSSYDIAYWVSKIHTFKIIHL